MEKTQGRSMAMAMLAVRSGKGLNARDFEAAWKACWPGEDGAAGFAKEKSTLSFRVSECSVTIAAVAAPIPDGDVSAAADRSWMWPEAREAMAQHRAHVIVCVLAGDRGPVEASTVLTRVMAALIRAGDPVGVYWGAAGMLIEPEAFVEGAKEAFEEGSLPLTLWINILVSSEKRRTTVTTRGMEALGEMEFEVLGAKLDPEDALTFVGGVCSYVVENGAELKHGETIGFTEKQKVKIEHRESAFDAGVRVVGLKL